MVSSPPPRHLGPYIKVQVATNEEVNGTRSLSLSQSNPHRLQSLDVIHLIAATVRRVN